MNKSKLTNGQITNATQQETNKKPVTPVTKLSKKLESLKEMKNC